MNRRIKFGLLCAVLSPFAILVQEAPAQSVTHPVLHRRGDVASAHPQATATHADKGSSLPDDASGEYALGEPGDVVEIILQGGRLDGYVSRTGDTDADWGAPLTFFFDRTAAQADRLSFTTWQVHSVWFSFEGAIVRGPVRSRAQDGLYLLTGELIEHNEAQRTQQRMSINLKLSQEEDQN
jgi:hypothetical protein